MPLRPYSEIKAEIEAAEATMADTLAHLYIERVVVPKIEKVATLGKVSCSVPSVVNHYDGQGFRGRIINGRDLQDIYAIVASTLAANEWDCRYDEGDDMLHIFPLKKSKRCGACGGDLTPPHTCTGEL